MKIKFLIVAFIFLQSQRGYAGIFDAFSTTAKYIGNIVTTGGKGCTRCGTPYNVQCMDSQGKKKMWYDKPIESCFALTSGGCRPRDEHMNAARKYCKDHGLILDEANAAKSEKSRGVAQSQFKSLHKAVDKVADTITPLATLGLGAVGGVTGAPTGQGGHAISGAINAATEMRAQNLQKRARTQSVKSVPSSYQYQDEDQNEESVEEENIDMDPEALPFQTQGSQFQGYPPQTQASSQQRSLSQATVSQSQGYSKKTTRPAQQGYPSQTAGDKPQGYSPEQTKRAQPLQARITH
ncbi:hypothetical protein [Holospora curviuscula]|uniref:Uncharacterized protein n=1 Tax=Holospora curviuscula TaxID=1082868 RepID=A0A2S5R6S5_9PROT|nr:hypothetical protein [Holospora curviuscula]PPE03031.1 hypothetical protein HCUR_01541 [Holospora curviuscula]